MSTNPAIVEAWFQDGSSFRAVYSSRESCLRFVREHELDNNTVALEVLITHEYRRPSFPYPLAFTDRIVSEPKTV